MDLNNWVIVFDLDDTLYSENDYFLSGLNAVEEFITKVYNVPFKGKIINANKAKVKDLWGWCCDTLNLPIDIKESLLWVYRLHTPDIHLYPGINKLLKESVSLDDMRANLSKSVLYDPASPKLLSPSVNWVIGISVFEL